MRALLVHERDVFPPLYEVWGSPKRGVLTPRPPPPPPLYPPLNPEYKDSRCTTYNTVPSTIRHAHVQDTILIIDGAVKVTSIIY